MLTDILLLSCLVFLTLIVLYILGSGIVPLLAKSDKPYARLFFSLLFGSILVVTIFATYVTFFKTIAVFFFPLLFVLYKRNRTTNKPTDWSSILTVKPYILLSIFSLVALAISVWLGFKEKGINSDIAYYNQIAEYFASGGNYENFYNHYNDIQPFFNGAEPYHYFEFWFGAIVNKCFSFTGFSSLMLFKYVTYNVFRVMVFVGVLALLELILEVNIGWIIFAVITTAFSTTFITDAFMNAWPMYTNMWFRPNYIFYYLCLIPVFYFFLQKEYWLAMTYAFIMIVVATVTAPAVLGGFGLYLLWSWINKEFSFSVVFKYAVTLVLFLFLILLFYIYNAPQQNDASFESYTLAQLVARTLSIWKAIVGQLIILSFKTIFIILIPLALLSLQTGFKEAWNKNKQLFLFSFFTAWCGIIVFQLVPYLDNMYQLPFAGYAACYLTFVIIAAQVVSGVRKVDVKNIIVICFIVAFVLTNIFELLSVAKPLKGFDAVAKRDACVLGHELSYVNVQSDYFKKNPQTKGGYIIAGADASSSYSGYRHSLTYQVGFYGGLFHSNHQLLLLSDPEELYPDKDTTTKDYLKTISFNKYAPFYFNYDHRNKYEENLLNFVNNHQLKFIYTSPDVSDSLIHLLPVNEVFVDPFSGEKFAVLQ